MSTLRSIGAITVAGYQQRTGDTVTGSGDVEAALDDAESRVAEHLRRQVDHEPALALDDYETRLRIHADGRVYPPAWPITASDLTVENTRTLLGATVDVGTFVGFFPASPSKPYATVAWTGGYDADTLPTSLADAIYDLANALATDRSPVPVGASSVSLGDASVSFSTGSEPREGLDTLVPGLTDRIRRYMNRLGDGLA